MKFHLDLMPSPLSRKITHADRLMLIGSCFSEQIGSLLNAHGFEAVINPGGIQYNPASVHDAILDAVNDGTDDRYTLQREDLFLSFMHRQVSAADIDELSVQLRSVRRAALDALRSSEFLILTFGTAFSYRHKERGIRVAVNHKQPHDHFERTLLSVDEIVQMYRDLLAVLRKLNPGLNVMFTVSPVKHLRDGVVDNSISKATLLLACSALSLETACHYFPAYELVTDDLRDYRFYKQDLAHPTDEAVEYVWEKFGRSCFDEPTRALNAQISALNAMRSHRSRGGTASEAGKFESNLRALEGQISEGLRSAKAARPAH